MLLENSAIDNNKNLNFLIKTSHYFNQNILIFYSYYFFFYKVNITLLITYNNNKLFKIQSLDKIFKSASWLERETGEMFKISYNLKIDSRRLLLDYSKQENPLLKDFPVEGFKDIFYDFFEDQVVYNHSTAVEI